MYILKDGCVNCVGKACVAVEENVYHIQNNPLAVLYHTLLSTLQLVFISPVMKIRNFFQFYCHKLADDTG